MTTANNDIQKYIDKLRQDQRKAQERFDSAIVSETLASNIYSKKVGLQGFYKGLIDMIKKTYTSGTDYTKTLERAIAQGEKVAGNANLGISATRILICQTIKTSNCTEVTRQWVNELSNDITKCSIPALTVTGIINEIKKELDIEIANFTELFNALLKALQFEQDLWASLKGKKGLVFQLTAMRDHANNGKKMDVEAISCREHKSFIPDIEGSELYKRLKEDLSKVESDLPEALRKRDEAKSAKEKAEAKKDALTNALKAALETKSCDTKKAAA